MKANKDGGTKKMFRVLNIWGHGKYHLCERMKLNERRQQLYFAYYNRYYTSRQEFERFYIMRVKQVLGIKKFKNEK